MMIDIDLYGLLILGLKYGFIIGSTTILLAKGINFAIKMFTKNI